MWDYEADVVIVGYGGAGATAAITAASAGAKVLILEKNPEGGGNTKYSGGSLRTYLDLNKAADYFEALCDGTTERDVVETFVAESNRNPEWLQSIGGEIVSKTATAAGHYPVIDPLAAFRSIKGAEGLGPRVRIKGRGAAAGIDLWEVLARKMAGTPVKILNSAPASRLIGEKGEGVVGVAAAAGEKEIKVRARRGVVLACGGFEYDVTMHRNYLGQSYFGLCNPGNTGDGIRLAGEVGADLWHMSAVAACLGIKVPEFEFGMRHSMPSGGYIYVDQLGKRFVDETGTDPHLMWSPTSYIDTKTLQSTRIPCHVIFDEDTRTRGAVGATDRGKISDVYQWSSDNRVEIRKGWIKAAESLAELAPQINLRPEQLQATVAQYNLNCVGGYDPEYGRAADTLVPLGRPPYYALTLWPCLYNTQGGPKRNSRAQIIDVRGSPIKRLYSAGELGSLWHRKYPGAGNVSEAVAFGRIAGMNAAAEPPIST